MLGLAAATLAFIQASVVAQPLNDHFTNAIIITGSTGSINGHNIFASAEPGEPRLSETSHYGRSTVWYRWQSTQQQAIEMKTASTSSQGDTVLSVYTGTTLSNLVRVAGNDDYLGDVSNYLNSRVYFQAAPATNYWVQVDSFAYSDAQLSQTPFALHWRPAAVHLTIARSNHELVLSWDAPGTFKLRGTSQLQGDSTVWFTNLAISPTFLPSDGTAQFFQLILE